MPRPPLASCRVALALAALLAPGVAAAQQRSPGAPGSDGASASAFRAEYFADVIPQVNEVMASWGRAWTTDDAEALSRLYSEDAILLPLEGDPVVGREAVAAHFEATLPAAGAMEAFMQAFDGSGGMAFVFGTFLSSGPGGPQVGELVTVFARRGRDWLIRAQTFRVADP